MQCDDSPTAHSLPGTSRSWPQVPSPLLGPSSHLAPCMPAQPARDLSRCSNQPTNQPLSSTALTWFTKHPLQHVAHPHLDSLGLCPSPDPYRPTSAGVWDTLLSAPPGRPALLCSFPHSAFVIMPANHTKPGPNNALINHPAHWSPPRPHGALLRHSARQPPNLPHHHLELTPQHT